MNNVDLLFYLVPVGSVIALVFAAILVKQIMKYSEGTEKMAKIAAAVRQGANAYRITSYNVCYTKLLRFLLDQTRVLYIAP